MKRIVAAVDHSEASLRAAALAADLARTYAAELVLLTVMRHPDAAASEVEAYAEAEHVRESSFVLRANAAQDQLANVLGRLELGESCGTKLVVRAGDAAEEILDYAAQGPADLIVIGHRGHGRVRQLLIGSVAKQVIDQAPCPTLVVR